MYSAPVNNAIIWDYTIFELTFLTVFCGKGFPNNTKNSITI